MEATKETGRNRLKTPAQAALELACSKRRIYALIAVGELEAVKIGPRGIRVVAESLDRFIERSRLSPGGAK